MRVTRCFRVIIDTRIGSFTSSETELSSISACWRYGPNMRSTIKVGLVSRSKSTLKRRTGHNKCWWCTSWKTASKCLWLIMRIRKLEKRHFSVLKLVGPRSGQSHSSWRNWSSKKCAQIQITCLIKGTVFRFLRRCALQNRWSSVTIFKYYRPW